MHILGIGEDRTYGIMAKGRRRHEIIKRNEKNEEIREEVTGYWSQNTRINNKGWSGGETGERRLQLRLKVK